MHYGFFSFSLNRADVASFNVNNDNGFFSLTYLAAGTFDFVCIYTTDGPVDPEVGSARVIVQESDGM